MARIYAIEKPPSVAIGDYAMLQQLSEANRKLDPEKAKPLEAALLDVCEVADSILRRSLYEFAEVAVAQVLSDLAAALSVRRGPT
jgi:hypothetical protein